MNRLLYEKSVSHKRHLIIPFILGKLDGEAIYSYQLLAELGHKGKLHKAENPAGVHSNSVNNIIAIAKNHLDQNLEVSNGDDYFKCRYTYCHDLIIIYETAGKYFYDHYKPEALNNVAAPKLFQSKRDCLNWIKQGLDRLQIGEEAEKI